MIVELQGKDIESEKDFHSSLAKAIDLGPYYGKNLYALRDSLRLNVERPLCLVWKNHKASKSYMPQRFMMIVEMLKQVAEEDKAYPREKRFEFSLE